MHSRSVEAVVVDEVVVVYLSLVSPAVGGGGEKDHGPPRRRSSCASSILIRSFATSSWAVIRPFTCSCSLPSDPPARFSMTC